jgi:hypothetical protein
LKRGDWVGVKCGPLEGIQGILVRKKNVYRLVLSVEMLGKSAAVEIDALLVERLSRKSTGAYGPDYAAASTHGASRIAGLIN